MRRLHSFSMTTLAALLSSAAITPAFAQQAQTAYEQTNQSGIADIVVTAQRRAESAQSTPLAITAAAATP